MRARLARKDQSAIEHIHRGDFECAIPLASAAEGMLPNTAEPHFWQKMLALEKSMLAGKEIQQR